jgi:DNA-binding transcriptional ArsR family regulator
MQANPRPEKSTREDRLDATLHALSDRTRRALLQRLAAGPAIVTELTSPFDISRTAVSKHLRVLEQAGLVSRAIDGRVHRCSITAKRLKDVDLWLRHYRHFWESTLDALAEFAERE